MAQEPGYPQQVPPAEYPRQVLPTGYAQQVPPTGYAQQVPPTGYPQQVPPTGYPQQVPPTGYPQQVPQTYTYAHGEGYQSTSTVVLGAPTPAGGPPRVVSLGEVGIWGPFPIHVVCPQCSATILTETEATPGLFTCLISGAVCLACCWLGCCLIPCCIKECKDLDHSCPNCKAHLGTYRRIGAYRRF